MYRNIEYIDRKTVHDVHNQLEHIAKTLRQWNADVDGLLVKTPADEMRQAAERQALREERERDAKQRRGNTRPDLDIGDR